MKVRFWNYTLFLLICTSMLVLSDFAEGGSSVEISSISTNYVTHDIIDIDGNAQLMSTAIAENWDLAGTRDGSQSAPYVIRNYNITGGSYLIKIQNTDLYVDIHDNYLNGLDVGFGGITLFNSTNIVIRDNIITRLSWGIGADSGSNYQIINNTVSNAAYGVRLYYMTDVNVTLNKISLGTNYGIQLVSTNSSSITHNTLIDNFVSISLDVATQNSILYNTILGGNIGVNIEDGVGTHVQNNTLSNQIYNAIRMAYGSSFNYLYNNSITYSKDGALIIEGSSEFHAIGNQIRYNSITDTEGNAMDIRNANNTIIFTNFIDNATNDGIFHQNSSNSTIQSNIIQHADDFAVDFDGTSNYNHVYRNQFVDNNVLGFSQATDLGNGNEFQYNYWNDWISPDINNDGVVDEPYQISVSPVKQEDSFPIVSPDNMNVIAQPIPSTLTIVSSSQTVTQISSQITTTPTTQNTGTSSTVSGLSGYSFTFVFIGIITVFIIKKRK